MSLQNTLLRLVAILKGDADQPAARQLTIDDPDSPDGDMQQRTIALSRIGEQLWMQLMEIERETGAYLWPLDIYVDDGDLFAIVARDGKLYRVDLNLSGDDVTLGSFIQVQEQFAPVQQQSRIVVRQQPDGRYRWLMVAATAILNRVGEIDSTTLFDSFIDYAERTGIYPRLDFYHLGAADPDAWEFGSADYLERDGVVYIASGTFDDDHPLAQAAIDRIQNEPGRWGASIEFRAQGDPELISAEPEIRIPVYTRGVNTRISIVLENDAAGHFTTVGLQREVLRMNRQKLLEYFGGEEEKLNEFLTEFEVDVTGINRTVEEAGLIHRSDEDEDTAEDTEDIPEDIVSSADESAEDTPEGDTEVEIDDATLELVAQAILESPVFAGRIADLVKPLKTSVDAVGDQVSQLAAGLDTERTRTDKRLQALERDEDEKQREWLSDLPSKKKISVSYRPRDAHRRQRDTDPDDDDEPTSMAEDAEAVLDKLPFKY